MINFLTILIPSFSDLHVADVRHASRHAISPLAIILVLGLTPGSVIGQTSPHEQEPAKEELLSVGGNRIQVVVFSPDEKRVVVAGQSFMVLRSIGGLRKATIFRSVNRETPDAHRRVSSVAFSSDEKRIVSGHWEGEVRLWDAETGVLLRHFEGQRGSVGNALFSPNERVIVSDCFFGQAKNGHLQHVVFVWDAETGKELLKLTGDNPRKTIWGISPDGKLIISRGGKFSPDGKLIVAQYSSGKETEAATDLEIWDIVTGRTVHVLKTPDVLANGKSIVIWDALSGKVISQLDWESSARVGPPAFSPDGTRIFSIEVSTNADFIRTWRDTTVRIWDIKSGEQIRALKINAPENHVLPSRSWLSPSCERASMITYRLYADGSIAKVWDFKRLLSPEQPNPNNAQDDPSQKLPQFITEATGKAPLHPAEQPTMPNDAAMKEGKCQADSDRANGQRITLSNAQITDELLLTLSEQKKLHLLRRASGANGDPTDIADITTLQLGLTSITDSAIPVLKDCMALQKLSLFSTKITDAGLKDLRNCPRLSFLDLSATKVTDAGLQELGQLSQLQWLYLNSTQLEGKGLRALEKLETLEHLHLRYSTINDSALPELARLKHLKVLLLSNTKLRGKRLHELRSLQNLEELYLDHIEVTDAALKDISELRKLKTLYVYSSRFSAAGVRELQRLESLEAMSLGLASDECLEAIATFTKLKAVGLHGKLVTDAGIETLQRAKPMLRINRSH